MFLILLEALGALLLLVLIVWWTMFSGRRNGELPDPLQDGDTSDAKPPPADTGSTGAARQDVPPQR